MRRLSIVLIVSLLILGPIPVSYAAAPSNDDFENATAVNALPFAESVSVVDATIQAEEPNPVCEPVDHTIWYRYTPTSNGQIVVNVTGSSMPVAGGLYTGSSLATLRSLGCLESFSPDTPVEMKLVFQASAGQTYYVQLGKGTSGDTIDTIQVSIQPGASISGTVRTIDHRPATACVDASDASGRFAGQAETGRRGRYQLSGLSEGVYLVEFMDCSVRTRRYATIWFNQKPDASTADQVAVLLGGAVAGIDAVLPLASP